MKKCIALLAALTAFGCGDGSGTPDGMAPTTDAGSDERGLWIDAEVGGVILENDNKVSSPLVVMKGGSRIQSATLTANGTEITKGPTEDMYDWALFGKDIGAAPGGDIKLVAKDGSETAVLDLRCPTNVVIHELAGPLTAGQKVTISWNGTIGGYQNSWSKPWIGIYPCDADGTHMHIPAPGEYENTKRLTGDETSAELTVPGDNDQDAYLVRLHVLGDMVDNEQGIGYCQLVRERLVVTPVR